ncbi:MAG: class I tRNA ligase family protein, partial [Candidatus Adiutricales bacterium]
TFRVYLMFMGDYLEGGDFRDEGVRAMRSFLDRVWNHVSYEDLDQAEPGENETLYWLHRTIKEVTSDLKRFSYNTSLARLMELLNHISRNSIKNKVVSETFIKLLAPFAPYISEELWQRLGHDQSVFNQSWPEYVEEYTRRSTIEYVVQINGKVRVKMAMDSGLAQEEIENLVMAHDRVQNLIEGKEIVKKIFVPNKLINLVVK